MTVHINLQNFSLAHYAPTAIVPDEEVRQTYKKRPIRFWLGGGFLEGKNPRVIRTWRGQLGYSVDHPVTGKRFRATIDCSSGQWVPCERAKHVRGKT